MKDIKNHNRAQEQGLFAGEGEVVDTEKLTGVDGAPTSFPIPAPRTLSGLYVWSQSVALPPTPNPIPPIPPIPTPPTSFPSSAFDGLAVDGQASSENQVAPLLAPNLFGREELRLDVDGLYPQMTASGTSYSRFTEICHWIASLTKIGTNSWSGLIWHKDGNTTAFPYTRVDISVLRLGIFPQSSKAIATFSGGASTSFRQTYSWKSSTFRPVEFEFDTTEDANPVLSLKTHDHPNRPSGLASEDLSIGSVFRRAGFGVTNSNGAGTIPRADAGANGTWSDAEMHDAMQTFWSRFSNAPRWALWVLSAALHDRGAELGGVMFDDIGPNHRQGTAVFTESFIKNPPPGDSSPDAWTRRMKFWTTAHEMGHAFNLAHSWQKSLGSPWLPLANEPEARSFMNYPFNVAGGQSAFFSDFEFRFSDAELLFMRHAPARFVQMGNANWFDDHGFASPESSEIQPEFRLEVRANRARPEFEFLEPVVLELKLTNASSEPKIVRANALSSQSMLAIIKRESKPARQWHPYAHYCEQSVARVLESGMALYQPLSVYAGVNGWDVSEPGTYDVQVAAEIDGQVVFSEPFRLRVKPPRSWNEEAIAADFFTENVGRTLWFNGTAVLDSANDTLHETVDRLPDSRAAIHAATALAQPLLKNYKTLDIPEPGVPITSVASAQGVIKENRTDLDEALGLIQDNMTEGRAAETLGHIGYRKQVENFSQALAQADTPDVAVSMQRSLHEVLSNRGVLETVLDEVASKIDWYEQRDPLAGQKQSADKSSRKKNNPGS